MNMDPKEIFGRNPQRYIRGRLPYRVEDADEIARAVKLPANATVVDMAAGTGILGQSFFPLSERVIFVEPNPDSRNQCKAMIDPSRHADIRAGVAEASGLESGIADLLVIGDALHWCNEKEALKEFRRILKPDGHLVVVNRFPDVRDPFIVALHDFMMHEPEYIAAPRKIIKDPKPDKTQPGLRERFFEPGFTMKHRKQTEAYTIDRMIDYMHTLSSCVDYLAKPENEEKVRHFLESRSALDGKIYFTWEIATIIGEPLRERTPDLGVITAGIQQDRNINDHPR